MDTTEARKMFEKALGDVSKVRFYDYKQVGMFEDKRITIKPRAVEMCEKPNCNAGDNCIHLVIKRNIPFCVY